MGEQLELPGLGDARGSDSPMVKACRLTIGALAEVGKLEPRHAVLTQLMLSLCEAIDAGRRQGRASAVAMAARELRDTLLTIDPPPEEGDAGTEALRMLREFTDAVEAAANNGGVIPGADQPS